MPNKSLPTKLPATAPQNSVVKILVDKDFYIRDTTKAGKGSHVNLKKKGVFFVITVPHGDVRRGTLNSILKKAGISTKEFNEAYYGSKKPPY